MEPILEEIKKQSFLDNQAKLLTSSLNEQNESENYVQMVMKEIEIKDKELKKSEKEMEKLKAEKVNVIHPETVQPKVYSIDTKLMAYMIGLAVLVCWGQIQFFIKDIVAVFLAVTIYIKLKKSYDTDKKSKTIKLFDQKGGKDGKLSPLTLELSKPIEFLVMVPMDGFNYDEKIIYDINQPLIPSVDEQSIILELPLGWKMEIPL